FRLRRLATAAVSWVAAEASPRPLAWLRVGLSAVLLLQAFAFASHLLDLYGPRGIVQRPLAALLRPPPLPGIARLTAAAAPFGLSDASCVRVVFLAYLTGLACLLLGWHTRAAAVVAWLTHLALKVSGGASVYGVDLFANIALFYCVWMPVGHAASLDL